MSWGYREWRPYVSVETKLRMAGSHAAAVAKSQKRPQQPVQISGRQIATTFWGKAWCHHLELYQDYSNRLPRGAAYVRNGSVVDLLIQPCRIEAIVAGSEPYDVQIDISPLSAKRWKSVKSDCSASIDSLLDLLSGKLSDGVMNRLTDRKTGLFPSPSEITLKCSCPDYSVCCKHIAAVMYGVGSRLDVQPELLFLLRGVDHTELASQAITAGNLDRELNTADNLLANEDLSSLFGIEIDQPKPADQSAKRTVHPRRKRIAAGPVTVPAAPARKSQREQLRNSGPKTVPAASSLSDKKRSRRKTGNGESMKETLARTIADLDAAIAGWETPAATTDTRSRKSVRPRKTGKQKTSASDRPRHQGRSGNSKATGAAGTRMK